MRYTTRSCFQPASSPATVGIHKVCQSIFMGAALSMMLAGCQKADAPAVTSDGKPAQTITNVTPIPQTPTRDPSLPEAAAVFGERDAGEKAKAMQDTARLQKEPTHAQEMTKQEESIAMPLPGQGGDHSATGLDKSKGK